MCHGTVGISYRAMVCVAVALLPMLLLASEPGRHEKKARYFKRWWSLATMAI